MKHRNPYVILGLPFGSSREEANVAFARKAKALRRQANLGRDALTDLTWALNQIDEALKHPDSAMHIYRIPADPDAFLSSGTGIFSPPPERLPARAADRSAALEELRRQAARQYLNVLLAARAKQVGIPLP